MELQEFIDRFGDEAFLQCEEQTILELNVEHCVIAPGGSIVYSEQAIDHLKRTSVIVFLDVSLDVLQARTNDVESRGIVYLKSKSYAELFDERQGLYRAYADITVPLDDGTLEQAITSIRQRLKLYMP